MWPVTAQRGLVWTAGPGAAGHSPIVCPAESKKAELQRRVRAAASFGDFPSVAAMADQLSFALSTVKRLGDGRMSPTVQTARLQEIATLCGVPFDWLHDGWDEVSVVDATDTDRIAALEDQVAHLLRRTPTDDQLRRTIDALVNARLAEGISTQGAPSRQRPATRANDKQAR